MKKIFTFIIFFYAFAGTGISQVKFEKEIRLESEYVPQIAQNLIDSMGFYKKIKWYKEIGLKQVTVEAKTKYEGHWYSIEFAENGEFEDVEVELKMRELPQATQTAIEQYLQSIFEKYCIRKVQVQYTGEPKAITHFVRNRKADDAIQKKYELVVASKVNKTFKTFEYLFSEKGEYLKKVEILLKNVDNIEY